MVSGAVIFAEFSGYKSLF